MNCFQLDSSVTDCIYDEASDTMIIQQSWNLDGYNEVLDDVSFSQQRRKTVKLYFSGN